MARATSASLGPRRYLTIASDGTVRLNGKATRWRFGGDAGGCLVLVSPARKFTGYYATASEARAYLTTLTEAELIA